MYTEGQTLKITATKHNLYVPEGTTFTVTVVRDVRPDWDHEVRVQFSAQDAAILNNRGRDQLSFAFKAIAPGFYPTWTIETADAESKPLPTPETPTSQELLDREGWNRLQSNYGPMMPEDSYEEYLHNFWDSGLIYEHPQPAAARPTYTVRLPEMGWERISIFEMSVVTEQKLPDGNRLSVAITDDTRRDDYIIGEALIVNEDNQIVECLDYDQIHLIGYDGTDRRTTFDELSGVMTAGEAVEVFGLAAPTVRQAINRGTIPARKSGGTWLLRRKDAETRWGKKGNK